MPRFENHVPDLLKADWCSIKEAGQILVVCRTTIMELIRDKRLETRKYFNNRTLVSRQSCIDLMKKMVY